jgi:prevent-host-death family protein
MKQAAISQLKARLSEHLDMVKRGEEVLVTERGRPVARIVPVERECLKDDWVRGLVSRGIVRAGRARIRPLLAHLPVCAVPEGTVLRALDKEREERR